MEIFTKVSGLMTLDKVMVYLAIKNKKSIMVIGI